MVPLPWIPILYHNPLDPSILFSVFFLITLSVSGYLWYPNPYLFLYTSSFPNPNDPMDLVSLPFLSYIYISLSLGVLLPLGDFLLLSLFLSIFLYIYPTPLSHSLGVGGDSFSFLIYIRISFFGGSPLSGGLPLS